MFENLEKVSFNIASVASYVYILSGQKFIKNAKNCQFGEFLKLKCDLLGDFKTLWNRARGEANPPRSRRQNSWNILFDKARNAAFPDFLSGKDFLVQQRKLSDILAIFPKLKRILICCFFLSDENLQLGPADIYQSSKSCLATLQNVKL